MQVWMPVNIDRQLESRSARSMRMLGTVSSQALVLNGT